MSEPWQEGSRSQCGAGGMSEPWGEGGRSQGGAPLGCLSPGERAAEVSVRPGGMSEPWGEGGRSQPLDSPKRSAVCPLRFVIFFN